MMVRPYSIDSMRAAARRRLPALPFDFVDGAAGSEEGARLNREGFQKLRMLPRVLVDTSSRSTERELFGRRYKLPFGVTPIGMANVVWPGTDEALAGAAMAAEIPYCLSTVASTSLERIAEVTDRRAWFQLYFSADQAIAEDVIDRAAAAGYEVLVVTADVPAPGKRHRDIVNGMGFPLRITPRTFVDFALHPNWSLSQLFLGQPRFASLERYVRPGQTESMSKIMAGQSSARLSWRHLGAIRKRWQGKLVVKGVLHPDDARRCFDEGCDGVAVSNHGGRQLDAAVAPIDVLPLIRDRVGPKATLLLDSGIRSGEDIARALAAGADFVMLGRAFLYACAAFGPKQGAGEAIRVLADELDRTLAFLGCRSVDELSPALFAKT